MWDAACEGRFQQHSHSEPLRPLVDVELERNEMWWRHRLAALGAQCQTRKPSEPGDTVHCWKLPWRVIALCPPSGGPLRPLRAPLWSSGALCGSLGPSLWPSLDRRPAAPPLCSCRCALAAPIGCSSRPGAGRLGSPPLHACDAPRPRCLQIMPTRRPPTPTAQRPLHLTVLSSRY